MSPEQYKKFESFQLKIFEASDQVVIVDECFGSELFQRMMDAAYEVFKKYDDTKKAKK